MASSIDIWKEARRRCLNHLRAGYVESGVNPRVVAKMDLATQVDQLMEKDGGEYIRVAFATLMPEVFDNATEE